MDNEKYLQELKSSLETEIKGGMDALKSQNEENQKALTAQIEESKKQLASVEERLAKMEAQPANRGDRARGIASDKYKGYKLNRQGQAFRKAIGKNDNSFLTLDNDEAIDEFTKFMIDLKKTMVDKDAEARADLQKFYEEKATMVGGTAANGGYLVPDEFAFDIVDLGRDRTFALNKCSVVPMGSDQLYLPSELTLATMYWKAETGQMTQGESTFGQVSLAAKNLTGFAIVTNPLLQDSAVDIVSLLSEQFGYGTALELDNQVLAGTGDPVSGVTTAAAGYSVVMSAGLTNYSSVTFDNIVDLIDKIPEGLDINLDIIINKSALAAIRKLKNSNNDYLLNQPGGMTPGTIWEVPYTKSSKVPKTTSASTAFMVAGNFKYFYIGRRLGAMTLEADPFGRFDYNQTRFRMVTRWALAYGQNTAFARLVTAAS